MSIIKGAYEISVWESFFSNGKFDERLLAVIGSDKMTSQNRVLEPVFTLQTNGQRSLTFKMFKRYVDAMTGETVENPFSSLLINERKVKLKYQDKWYEFIIKEIQENSTTYLYSYTLKDAMVQELSKNGFGVVFDSQENNNTGDVETLASRALQETDWDVKSEVVVQTIKENLVYVDLSGVHKGGVIIYDQDKNKLSEGLGGMSTGEFIGQKVLAFYSSCTGCPRRFQFIYLPGGYTVDNVKTDKNRIITNANCQYSIQFTEDEYGEEDAYGFRLPKGASLISDYVVSPSGAEEIETDTTVSHFYCGNRYNFIHEQVYVPLLDKYVYKYRKGGKGHYGFVETTYESPILIQNYISDPEMKGTSAWVGTTFTNNSENSATVEPVFGRLGTDGFTDYFSLSTTTTNLNEQVPYLRLSFKSDSAAVLNSSIYDNRTVIGNFAVGDKLVLNYEAFDEEGEPTTLNFDLIECVYSSGTGTYEEKEQGIVFTKNDNIFTVTKNNYTKDTFKRDSRVRLRITGTGTDANVYLKKLELYRYVLGADNQPLTPLTSAANATNGIVVQKYYYISADDVDTATDASALTYHITESRDFSYAPVENSDGHKIRSITIKESNYFNILQTIAETFGVWLELVVDHDENGKITKKTAVFRNYIGSDNYACFRYGVNLKDIQRTHASKEIVTKLMVKNNNNQYANNGSCSIQRAAANISGENYIYDFQYFENQGLLSAEDVAVLYMPGENPLNNYFTKLRVINTNLIEYSETLNGLLADLVNVEAKLETYKAQLDASTTEIEVLVEEIRKASKIDGFPVTVLTKEQRNSDNVRGRLREYQEQLIIQRDAAAQVAIFEGSKNNINNDINEINTEIDRLKREKIDLNRLFYEVYSPFVQEGTWINEEYVDDNLYYADALSVMYNSCYPKVSYQINALELSALPGYELFTFQVGDKTFVEDREFFGSDYREEVVITEISYNLDDPSKNTIKVQNFKDQFQDLFQKITATVQQTQYNEGSYRKGEALVDGIQERKYTFLTEALSGATAAVQVGGQHTVVSNKSGITITDDSDRNNQIRMVGGAILLSKKDEQTGEQRWTTGITPDGISANLITAGRVDTGRVSIMNDNQERFRWDAYGLNAFGEQQNGNTPFVRFDENGIYGIPDKDGTTWRPTTIGSVDDAATFALTWEGLKITGSDAVAHIGKQGDDIMTVTKGKDATFSISSSGDVSMTGIIHATDGEFSGDITSSNVRLTGGVIESGNFEFLIKNLAIEVPYLMANPLNINFNKEEIDALTEQTIIYLTVKYIDNYHQQTTEENREVTASNIKQNNYIYTFVPRVEPYNVPVQGASAKIVTSFADSGMQINLNEGTITSPNFSIDKDGNTTMSGTVYATDGEFTGTIKADSGYIGQWDISQGALKNADETLILDPTNGMQFGIETTEEDTYSFSRTFEISKLPNESFGVIRNSQEGQIGESGTRYTVRMKSPQDTLLNSLPESSSDYFWSQLGQSYIGSNFVYLGSDGFGLTSIKSSSSSNNLSITGDGFKADFYPFTIGSLQVLDQEKTLLDRYLFEQFQDGSQDGVSALWYYPGGYSTNEASGKKIVLRNYNNTLFIGAVSGNVGNSGNPTVAPQNVKIGYRYNDDNQTNGELRGVWEIDKISKTEIVDLQIPFEGGSFTCSAPIMPALRSGKPNPNTYVNLYIGKDKSSSNAKDYTITVARGQWNFNGTASLDNGKFTVTSAIQTSSDVKKKHFIKSLPSVYSDIFDKLQPVSYKYNDGRSDRTHTGFIAQDVEQAVLDAGLTTKDFAAVCYEINPETGEKEDYTIRYEELIALCVQQIQTLKGQVASLEERLAHLEQK